ncbi:hypothetical protein B0H16DRAFT_1327810 [Mycena metata]|uniref:Transmembrane protein n=1 Tax=Mycena metata TaxID=1033252 RepID=A0AAD7I2W7_9AGAR|nr:hypothetical protein B0H16DRAFT_1327810 [Mycena metata]
MFFILLTRQSGATQGHPHFLLRAPPEALCDSTVNSCRTLFEIIKGCLATIFACTWVALHPNVPDPKLKWFSLPLRKLGMMLVMIIAPELVLVFAGRQRASALWISERLNISTTHGFFCTMGGFVTEKRHPVATVGQLDAYKAVIQAIDEEDITDKSTGDALSKGIALVQTLWFVTQCMARVLHRLPLTELEVATLAFATLSTVIRLLWWHKPQNAQRPIILPGKDPLEARNRGATRTRNESTILQRLAAIFGTSAQRPITVPDSALEDGNGEAGESIMLQHLADAIFGTYAEYSPVSSTSVPTFYSIAPPSNAPYQVASRAGVFWPATIFGGIHCVAWHVLFPSTLEMWAWRLCSVFTTACLVLLPLTFSDKLFQKPLIVNLVWLEVVLYILCRLALIVLCFTTLRALSPADLVDVSWSKYLLHV